MRFVPALVLGLVLANVPVATTAQDRAYTIDELEARCRAASAEIVDACLFVVDMILVPEAGHIPPQLGGTGDGSTDGGVTGSGDVAFGDGTHVVGTDIRPGTYRSRHPVSCYWARLSGFGGSVDDIIANDNVSGYAVVTIAPTDEGFETRGCDWSTDLSAVIGPGEGIPEGTLIVGTDIRPGTYRTSGDCYWARLSGFGGTIDDIIANDNANGAAVVTIAPSDRGFTSIRCDTWR